jgi:hypothetical protein
MQILPEDFIYGAISHRQGVGCGHTQGRQSWGYAKILLIGTGQFSFKGFWKN